MVTVVATVRSRLDCNGTCLVVLYFAYGSNLCPRQMQRRCPGARAVGRAILRDWKLILTTRGTANIVRARDERLHGALWRFAPRHIALMDAWEGVAAGAYRRAWIRVECPDGRVLTAVTYIGARRSPGIGKAHYILQRMLPGAAAFALPEEFHDEIRGWLPARPIAAAQTYRGRRRSRSRTHQT